eukprot:3420704-Amphidinium_carterae.1
MSLPNHPSPNPKVAKESSKKSTAAQVILGVFVYHDSAGVLISPNFRSCLGQRKTTGRKLREQRKRSHSGPPLGPIGASSRGNGARQGSKASCSRILSGIHPQHCQ